MLTECIRLECKVNDKSHFYLVNRDVSTVEAKEALVQFLKMIGQIEDNAKAQQTIVETEAVKPTEILSSEEECLDK
jgi:hypothetical protein